MVLIQQLLINISKNVDCTSKKTNSASAITLDHSNGRKLTYPVSFLSFVKIIE